MKKYKEKDFGNNIINKYNALASKKLSKSKSYSIINSNNLLLKKNNINIKLNIKKKKKKKKYKKLKKKTKKKNKKYISN